MHDVVVSQEPQRDQQLDCESSDKRLRNALKVVQLDELVQIHAEHLKRKHQMLPKNELIMQSDHISLVFRVPLLQRLQQASLNKPLLVQSCLIA